MKAIICTGFAFLLASCLFAVEVGDTKEEVLREMGEPTAFSDLGEKSLMLYPRGKVVLVNDLVASTTVASPEELLKREQAELARIKMREEMRSEERKLRIAEGKQMLAELKVNPTFLESSPRRQLAILEQFQARYPEVDIAALIIPARSAARDALITEGTKLAENMRRDPAFIQMGWKDRLTALKEFIRRYPDVEIDDLKASVIADRDRDLEDQRRREEIARLRRDAAQSEARRATEERLRRETEDALARAERENRQHRINQYYRYSPYPVYVPAPTQPKVDPPTPTPVYKRETFLERNQRAAARITGTKLP